MPQAHNLQQFATQQDLVTFLHATTGYPVPSTWINTIQAGNYSTWPGLNPQLVHQHLPKSTAMVKGHMQQQLQNTISTKPPMPKQTNEQPMLHSQLKAHQHEPQTNLVFATIIETTGRIATDLTGRFPVTSSSGYKYMLLIYDYDSNVIIVEPLRSRADTQLIHAYTKLHRILTDAGLNPSVQRLDNEASQALKRVIEECNIHFQLAPHTQLLQ
jgi:hypothetical protein